MSDSVVWSVLPSVYFVKACAIPLPDIWDKATESFVMIWTSFPCSNSCEGDSSDQRAL